MDLKKGSIPEEADPKEIQRVFELQMAYHTQLGATTARERLAKLKQLHAVLLASRPKIYQAMLADFAKPQLEVDLSEIYPVLHDIRFARKNLRRWMSPQPVTTPLVFLGSSSWVQYESKGVCLIISPWNFPFLLTLGPLVSAIAAGNTAIIKPSEYTPHSTAVMREIVESIFEEREVAFFEGTVPTSNALLALPFHHIFFTGSPSVGKIVMAAAAKHLSSITLELGGKSPVFIDETAHLKEAARRLAFTKYLNNGQACVSPDYILIHESKKAAFLKELKAQLIKKYGTDPSKNPDYCRIVSEKHFLRLKKYLEQANAQGAELVTGGQTQDTDRYIAPTIIAGLQANSPFLQEEIFGPILPVVTYKNLDEAIRVVNEKERPLSLYIYSQNRKNIRHIIRHTRAGGTAINNSVVYFLNNHLPFGGVNNSGMGRSHGFAGFQAFSNQRAFYRQYLPAATELISPPYTRFTLWLSNFVTKWL
ncbi:MAG TPA: aldehyde dehydrogenase family protein [Saprospiraceae bacterium]|nr:aldehyde dehydrogenase family protein [Saprospiraceae bacterium]HMQ83084.1 aldehyde dehydrogenase family protein [Saprospiraceae bacterium]